MNGFAAALFDLDGTLIQSKGVIGKCINLTLVHFGYEPFEEAELHDLIGIPLGEALSFKTEEIKPLIDYFRTIYLKNYLKDTTVFDGMEDVLATLKAQGKKIGIVTLKHTPVAQRVLATLKLGDYIDYVEGDDDVSKLKPHPEHIHRLCRALNVSSEDSVVIGDTVMDIEAGKGACCRTIGVLWGAMSMDDLSDAGADYLASSPRELGVLLGRL